MPTSLVDPDQHDATMLARQLQMILHSVCLKYRLRCIDRQPLQLATACASIEPTWPAGSVSAKNSVGR